jgi:hypothetical protein
MAYRIDGYRRRTLPFAEQLRRRTWTDMAADFVRAMTQAESTATRPNPGILDGDNRHPAG